LLFFCFSPHTHTLSLSLLSFLFLSHTLTDIKIYMHYCEKMIRYLTNNTIKSGTYMIDCIKGVKKVIYIIKSVTPFRRKVTSPCMMMMKCNNITEILRFPTDRLTKQVSNHIFTKNGVHNHAQTFDTFKFG
jgi:hypothetical protein